MTCERAISFNYLFTWSTVKTIEQRCSIPVPLQWLQQSWCSRHFMIGKIRLRDLGVLFYAWLVLIRLSTETHVYRGQAIPFTRISAIFTRLEQRAGMSFTRSGGISPLFSRYLNLSKACIIPFVTTRAEDDSSPAEKGFAQERRGPGKRPPPKTQGCRLPEEIRFDILGQLPVEHADIQIFYGFTQSFLKIEITRMKILNLKIERNLQAGEKDRRSQVIGIIHSPYSSSPYSSTAPCSRITPHWVNSRQAAIAGASILTESSWAL